MSDLIKEFYELAKDTNFNVLGLLTSDYKILTLGSDSKLIGRIFELISKQLLQKICVIHGWTLEETESQTTYPVLLLAKKKEIKLPWTSKQHIEDTINMVFQNLALH